jgi:hypothetical protein
VLDQLGTEGRDEKLLKLYLTLHGACRRAGKELIVRDFIVKSEDYETFLAVLPKLPSDIIIMTKEILADWMHNWMGLNPFIWRYLDRKLVVEFDLYGEYWGRLGIPACYPLYIHTMMRSIKSAGAIGAVGRVIHDDRRSSNFDTIFESPNDINVYTFSRLLSHPMPWLERGAFTDPRERAGRWGSDIDAFDQKMWVEWAEARYGRHAAVPLIRAFRRTYDILSLITDLGGRYFQHHSYLPAPNNIIYLWEPFSDQVESLGIDFLRDEKSEAYRLTQQCLEDVKSARAALNAQDYEQLTSLFEGELLIINAYQALIEGYYQLYLSQHKPNRDGLLEASRSMKSLTVRISKDRGASFFGDLPDTLSKQSELVAAGKVPERIRGLGGTYTEPADIRQRARAFRGQ